MTSSTHNQKLNTRLIFISWKDINNPAAGGAELVHQELSKRLVADGVEVIHLVPGFKNCIPEEIVDGIRIIRVGKSVLNFYSLPGYYRTHIKQDNDIVIDGFNCFGSFTWLGLDPKRTFFFIHHVQNEIWFHQTTPPFVFPLNYVGWILEKIQLWITALLFRGQTITISESTKNDLVRYGFSKLRISLIREAIDIQYIPDLTHSLPKEQPFTVLFLSGLRSMKRPLDALKGFSLFHERYPNTHMWIAGAGGEGSEEESLITHISEHKLESSVTLLGRVSAQGKREILQKASIMLVTSVKEGWGLIVTEANSQGLPVISYDVPGLRDSNQKGILTHKNSPHDLAFDLERVYQDPTFLATLRYESWMDSQRYSFEQSYIDFKKAIQLQS